MSDDKYRAVHHELNQYPCGLKPGDKLRIKRVIQRTDHNGRATGESYAVGEVWTVLAGSEEEPRVIWLQQQNGKPHTWDDDDIFETFERVEDH